MPKTITQLPAAASAAANAVVAADNAAGTLTEKVTFQQIVALALASPAVTGNASFEASAGVPLTVTNTGTGNSFVVNDETSDTSPFVIDASGRVGIGTSAPETTLHVDAGTITTQRYGAQGAVIFRSASGTKAVPTAIAAAETPVATIVARSYDGTVYRDVASINSITDGATSGTSSPGYMTFATTPIGSVSSSERLRITSGGVLQVAGGGTAAAPIFVSTVGTTDTGIFFPAADVIAFSTAGAERMRIDSSGNIGIGTGFPISPLDLYNATTAQLRVRGDSTTAITMSRYSADTTSSTVQFIKGRGTNASPATAVNGDLLGELYFFGHNGTTVALGAMIRAQSDGTISASAMPGRLVFFTTPTGSNTPATRLSITNSGVMEVAGGGTAAAPIFVSTVGTTDTGVWFPAADTIAVSSAGTERLRIDSTGRVGIGTTNPSSILDVVGGRSIFAAASEAFGVGAKFSSTGGAVYFGAASASATPDVQISNAGGASVLYIQNGGSVGIGGISPTISSGIGLHLNGSTLRLDTARTPASAAATGNTGEICWDASYLYICTGTNTWRRIAHTTW